MCCIGFDASTLSFQPQLVAFEGSAFDSIGLKYLAIFESSETEG